MAVYHDTSTQTSSEETVMEANDICSHEPTGTIHESTIFTTGPEQVTCEECMMAWVVPWHKPSHHNLLHNLFKLPREQRYGYVENRAAEGCDFSCIILKYLKSISIEGSTGHLSHFWEQDANESVLHLHVYRDISSEGRTEL
jgi:hypothetical protein